MARAGLSEQERAERQARQRELVTRSIEALRTSDGWQSWLRTRKAFRRYSPTNTMLIALQCPDATYVAGFRAWLKLGYCVRKGESALRIWAPVPPSKSALEAWREAGSREYDKPRTRFRLTAVFDRSQVQELPPPAEPAQLEPPIEPITGSELSERIPSLVALAASIGSSVAFETVARGDGSYNTSTKAIVISSELAGSARAAVLIHELAHALVRAEHADRDPTLDYAAEELVAETVSYMVSDTLGLDTAASAVPYLATWAETADLSLLERTATLIDRLARRIEDAVLDAPERAAA